MKKNKVFLGLKIILTFGLLAYLFKRVDIHTLAESFHKIHWGWYVGAYLSIWISMVTLVWRWQSLVRAEGKRVDFKILFPYHMIGYFFGNFLPRLIGGDGVKAYLMSKLGFSKTRSFAILVFARAIGAMALFFISIVSLIISRTLIEKTGIPSSLVWIWSLLVLAGAVVAYLALTSNVAARFLRRHENILTRSLIVLHDFRSHLYLLLGAFSISVFHQLIVFLRYFFVSKSLGIEVDYASMAVICSLVFALTMIPITVNGVGIRENGFVYLLGILGVNGEDAIVFSLLNYGLMILMGMAGGAFYLWSLRVEPIKAVPVRESISVKKKTVLS